MIASQSEPHLQVSFYQIEDKVPGGFCRLEMPIDSDEAVQEVETYICAEFLKIKKDFWDVIAGHWSPETDLLKIAITSSVFFVFTSTSLYIKYHNLVHRLSTL
jgi:hypothetical protein